jgi:hypothetical protein
LLSCVASGRRGFCLVSFLLSRFWALDGVSGFGFSYFFDWVSGCDGVCWDV